MGSRMPTLTLTDPGIDSGEGAYGLAQSVTILGGVLSTSETCLSFPKTPSTVSLRMGTNRRQGGGARIRGSVTAMSTTPVLAERSAGIELAGMTEKVTAAKVEALGPQVEGEARHAKAWYIARARAKSICCGDGIQARVILPPEIVPLLDVLMRIGLVILEG